MSQVEVYAVGICSASVCASSDTSIEEVERVANKQHPTGIASGWRKSSNETFANGDPHPRPCENDPDRLHWLLNC